MSTIVIIEDEEKLLDLMLFNLKERYDVQGYKDAESFLSSFYPDTVSMVITDVKLPGIDGITLLSRIKKRAPDIPVVIITAFGSINQAVHAIKLGAYDYLTKPVSIEDLENTIERAQKFISSIDVSAPLFPEDGTFITKDPDTLKQCELAAKASPMKVPVLILGETGTGKELIAEMIHNASGRKGNLVKINCAAIPSELLEGELFGYNKGAFTGADACYEGKLRLADRGTLFLDEIGEMNEALQAKLLRVIETESFYPVGDNDLCKVDLRIIAATNKNIKQEVKKGTFRSDLYYRLAVVPIRIPPLRERPEDIRLIAYNIIEELKENGKLSAKSIDETVFMQLEVYTWPGNVRELRNVLTHMVLLSPNKRITLKDLPDELSPSERSETDTKDAGYPPNFAHIEAPQTYEELKQKKKEIKNEAYTELEINFLTGALEKNGWNVSKTAAAVGIDRRLLQNMMKKHGIKKERN